MTTTTRFIGNCQVCEHDQKLHEGKMVHHGYKRPGHGTIEGDCPGVSQVPYEVSCDLVKSYKVRVEASLVNLMTYLADLKAGKITHIRELTGWATWVEYIAGVTEPYKWARAIEHKVWAVESNIRHTEFEIARCARRIAAWGPMPIRTVEEEQAKADLDKAARKAEKEAARAARFAKQAATKAKQDAHKAKRAAIVEEFEAKFRALADGSEDIETRKLQARELLAETKKSKYSWMSLYYDFTCDDAFIALGLAEVQATRPDGRKLLRWFF